MKKTVIQAAISSAFLLGGMGVGGNAMATGAVAGATEPTQILNNIELAAQTIKQIEQHATQVNNWVTNVNKLKDAIVQAGQFDLSVLQPFYDVAGSLYSIGQSVQTLQGIAYSMDNLDLKFRASFKGYIANQNINQQYRDWSATVNDTLESTMKGIELTRKEIENETTFAKKLQDMAKTSDGRNKLEQTIVAFANESIAQSQKLRTLMLMDMQSKQAYQAYVVNDQMLRHANTEEAFNRNKTPQSSPGKTPILNF